MKKSKGSSGAIKKITNIIKQAATELKKMYKHLELLKKEEKKSRKVKKKAKKKVTKKKSSKRKSKSK